jgi:hypothetical protein
VPLTGSIASGLGVANAPSLFSGARASPGRSAPATESSLDGDALISSSSLAESSSFD